MLGALIEVGQGYTRGSRGRDTCLGGRLLLWFWRGRLVGWRGL